MLKEYWDLFREWVKNTLRSRIFWLGIVCTLFLAVLVVRLFQLQILDGAAYYDSYVSRTKKEITTTATRGTIYDRNGVVLAGNEAVYNLTVKDTSEYTKANGDFNEMLLRLMEIVKKYDGTIVTELPVIIDDDGQFAYSGKDSAIRQLIRDVYGTSYIEEKSKEGEDVYTYDAETVMKRLMKVSYNFTTRWENAETISKEDALAIYSLCDLYLNPIRLGGGTSAAESMSEGVPVLTTDLGDVALEVEDAYKVKDYEEMKQRIFELEADHKQWEKWSQAAKEKAEELTDSKTEFIKIIKQIEKCMESKDK